MVDIIVCGAKHLYTELVQRVIVTAPHTYRPPGITTLYASLHADGIDLLLESLFLFFILHLQKELLPLEFKNRSHIFLSRI